MGKAATRAITARTKTSPNTVAAEGIRMKRKKKKGRPSLADLQKRQQQKALTSVSNSNSAPSRRSTRRNPSNYNSGSSEFVNDDYDDDDDERKEKKVKLVVRLPQSNNNQQQQHLQNSSSQNSGSASDSEPEELEDQEGSLKKRKINAVDRRSNDVVSNQVEKGTKAMDTLHGSPLESGPTTPLPDKKLLVFILDRLQKKDTYGVFSEPVDPNELPDYHDIIDQPMDFGTVRKKLDGRSYSNLEELEADVFLICSNAMQYNAPDTVYFRQARTIQELAKRDFENLRHEGDNGEPQPKVVRRGRPPSKNVKKPVESSPVDRVAVDHSSGATLASGEDKGNGSNGYNLRKAPVFYKFRSNDGFATSLRPRNGENYSEWLVDWNSEFPASILKADMKYGKKHFTVDENRRDTYKQFHPSASSNGQSCLSNAPVDMRRFIPVGLHFEPHGYARSLARYAANLGPVAWKIASRKLKCTLPDGISFGPGWVGEDEAPPQLLSFPAEKQRSVNSLIGDVDSNRPVPSFPGVSSAMLCRPSEEMIEAVRRLNSQNELAEQGSGSPWMSPGSSSFPAQQQKSLVQPNRNGFNAMFGYDLSSQMGLSQMGLSRFATSSGAAREEGGLTSSSSSYQMPGGMFSAGGFIGSSVNPAAAVPSSSFHANAEAMRSLQTWGAAAAAAAEVGGGGSCTTSKPPPLQVLASPSSSYQQQRLPLILPPDLNVASSSPTSSSLQIGSPQQPDLALQL